MPGATTKMLEENGERNVSGPNVEEDVCDVIEKTKRGRFVGEENKYGGRGRDRGIKMSGEM